MNIFINLLANLVFLNLEKRSYIWRIILGLGGMLHSFEDLYTF